MKRYPSFILELPHWMENEVGDTERIYSTDSEKMDLAIRLSKRNVIEKTGGPFGACVFEMETGKLIAPGVNLVVPGNCSIAHAEAVAVVFAQQVCESFDLAADNLPDMELVTSSQPCIQCFGIIWWSGLKRVIIGATNEDVERLTGFEEGPLPKSWRKILNHRPPLEPIYVVEGIMRDNACEVLDFYKQSGELVYNPGST